MTPSCSSTLFISSSDISMTPLPLHFALTPLPFPFAIGSRRRIIPGQSPTRRGRVGTLTSSNLAVSSNHSKRILPATTWVRIGPFCTLHLKHIDGYTSGEGRCHGTTKSKNVTARVFQQPTCHTNTISVSFNYTTPDVQSTNFPNHDQTGSPSKITGSCFVELKLYYIYMYI